MDDGGFVDRMVERRLGGLSVWVLLLAEMVSWSVFCEDVVCGFVSPSVWAIGVSMVGVIGVVVVMRIYMYVSFDPYRN